MTRALPARRRPGQAQAAQARCARTSRTSSSARRGSARCGPAPGRHRRHGAQPRRRGAARRRAARVGRPGLRASRATALDELVERAGRACRPAERAKVPGIKPARADIILAGAVVVQTVLEAGGFEGIEVDRGGPARGRLLRAPPRRRPAAVRRRAPRQRASTSPRSTAWTPSQPAHRARRAPRARAVRRARRGRPARRRPAASASCCGPRRMLHDIGMTVDYDDHHKHSRYLILNAGLPGLHASARSRSSARPSRYHRKGHARPGPVRAARRPGDEQRLDRDADAAAPGRGPRARRDQLVREAHVDAPTARCASSSSPTATCASPRWAAGREVELFARAFGKRADEVAPYGLARPE